MRLSPEEVAAIKRLVAAAYGPDAVVRLFGSRADDRRRGGDVDLHVIVPGDDLDTRDRFWTEVQLGGRLEAVLGERKVDLIVRRDDEPQRAIDRIAIRTGIVL